MRYACLCIAVALSALPAVADEPDLVGVWTARGDGYEIRVAFERGGRIEVVERGPAGAETTRGTYEVGADAIVVRAEGEVLRYPYRLEADGSLVIRDVDGSRIHLRRQTSAPPRTTGVPRSFVPYSLFDHGGLLHPATGKPLEVFRMLIPKGWRFQGGITWKINVKGVMNLTRADLANPAEIAFRVVSPDGKAWVEVYPEIRFADLTQAPAGPLFPPGKPYGGMISMPVVDPFAYVERIVFPRFRQGVVDPRLVARTEAPELAALFLDEARRFDAAAGVVQAGRMHIAAGSATYDYGFQGETYREQFLAALAYLETPGITMWSSRAAWSMGAPRAEHAAYVPALMMCVYSIQFRPLWLLRYMKLVHENWKGIAETDAVIAKIDSEIVRSRVATTHKINQEVQKVLLPWADFESPNGGPPIMLPSGGPHYMNRNTGEVEPGTGEGGHPREDDPNWQKLGRVN